MRIVQNRLESFKDLTSARSTHWQPVCECWMELGEVVAQVGEELAGEFCLEISSGTFKNVCSVCSRINLGPGSDIMDDFASRHMLSSLQGLGRLYKDKVR